MAEGSGGVSIFLNDGSGTFTQSSTVGVGVNPYSITAGDLDGDGDIDLAVVDRDYILKRVSILLNNGSGAFTQSSTVGVGSYPWSITTGDLDGDGDLDLAVANYFDNTVSILVNNSRGKFTQSSTMSVGWAPQSVFAGDFDGDGDLDLAVAEGSGGVSILLNDGSGTFTQSSSLGVGLNPYSVTAGDLDGDGDLDLAVANSFSNTVSILLNNGSGIFTQRSTPTVGDHPMSVITGDFDEDGDLDLAVANAYSNTISILMNRSRSAWIKLSMPSLSFGTSAVDSSKNQYLRIYNLDVDSSLVISNIASSNAVFTIDPVMPTIAPGDSVTITISFKPTEIKNYFDSLTITSNDQFNPTTKVYLTGFGNPITSVTPQPNALDIVSNTLIIVKFWFDVDNSTLNDTTVRINGSLSGLHPAVFSYNASTKTATIDPSSDFQFGELVSVTVTRGIKSIVGDSMEIAQSWSFTIATNGGSGQFTQSSTPGVGTGPYSVITGDLDGDWDIDLAVANYSSNTVSILLNNGSGGFTQSSTLSVESNPRSVTAGDLDGDGDLDLAVVIEYSNTVLILLNNGSGGFTQSSTPGVGNNNEIEMVVAAAGESTLIVVGKKNHPLLVREVPYSWLDNNEANLERLGREIQRTVYKTAV